MAEKRKGLGRGIGSLIPSVSEEARPSDVFFPQQQEASLVTVPGASLALLDPHLIIPNPRQPRKEFKEEELAELIHSVREFGVLQPVVVRKIEMKNGHDQYELIMGERRLRASKAAGLNTIPAVIRDTEDENMLRDALLENLHRSELNPLEEASAYQQLMDDFGITQEQLANRIGRSRPQISNTIRLLRLPISVQTKVAAGVLSAGHARTVLSLETPEEMERLANRIIEQELSVREAENIAKTGSISPKRSKRPVAGSKQDQLNEISDLLADQLDTRVKISIGPKKGQIVIDFATIEDLNRILDQMGVDRFRGI